MHTALCPFEPLQKRVRANARALCSGRVVFAVTLATVVVGSLACSQRSVSSNASSQVRGATYRLRAVDGALLPARFAPLDDPQLASAARIDSGRIAFQADGRATGAWHGTGETVGFSKVFQADYTEDGARVLIHTGDGVPPDTADIADNTMTVRAQFVHPRSRERYVVVMQYEK